MKNISFLFIFILLISSSCSDFGDLNQNPNQPTAVPTSTLFTSSLSSISDVISASNSVLYTQMMAETQHTHASRYGDVHFDFNDFYLGPLANLNEIIRLNTEEASKESIQISGSNSNQIAVARILKAYFYHSMTDRWGPLPYQEALQGGANFAPSYQSQEFIYKDIFKELSEAVAQIREEEKAIEGDFLFQGDMLRWKQFANTLHLIMALRLSEVEESKAEFEFNQALNASGGVINAIEDNIFYPYLAETQQPNPWYNHFLTRSDYAISEPLVNHLKATNDPRIMHFADAASAQNPEDAVAPDSPQEVAGMPYGIESAAAIEIPNSAVSFPNATYVRGENVPLAIFTYSQVLFSMAEAAHRGWINEDAQALYYGAIAASMAQWEVPMGNFLQQSYVKWNNNKALQLIGEQKWVALYTQGDEAWAEWRRLGYPALSPAPAALNESGEIPRRLAYPLSEQSINAENYEAAVRLLDGEDNLDTRIWWDKE